MLPSLLVRGSLLSGGLYYYYYYIIRRGTPITNTPGTDGLNEREGTKLRFCVQGILKEFYPPRNGVYAPSL